MEDKKLNKKFEEGFRILKKTKERIEKMFVGYSQNKKAELIGIVYGGFANRHLGRQDYYFRERDQTERKRNKTLKVIVNKKGEIKSE